MNNVRRKSKKKGTSFDPKVKSEFIRKRFKKKSTPRIGTIKMSINEKGQS